MTLTDLAALDELAGVQPDLAVWTANLAALRGACPALAEQLAAVAIPADWRLVRALDGWPTWRNEPPGAAATWPCGSATPATRAAALLDFDALRNKNPALATIGAGAALARLLDRLDPRQAVYVFESDLVRLAAVLRVVDIAAAVAAPRCFLIPPVGEQAYLEDLLDQHPGLLPPASIITLPGVLPERLARVRSICEAVARTTSRRRHARLQALAETPVRDSPARDGVRLAVMALTDTPAHHALAEAIAGAGRSLGWEVCCRVARGPCDVFPLPHCEALREFGPGLTIAIGSDPRALPVSPGGVVCRWHTDPRDVPDSIPADDTIHLAATPRIARLLREAGVPTDRRRDFLLACPQDVAPAADAPPQAADPEPISSVVIAGDLPDAGAEACGIVQPTHVQLWAALRARAEEACAAAEIHQPATLLRQAERKSGVSLRESALRARMLRILEYVLIPAVVLETIQRWLAREEYEVFVAGAGWERICSDGSRILPAEPSAWLARGPAPSRSAVVLAGSTDPLSPTLLAAAAGGWPVLLHSPGSESPATRLGGMLHPGQHLLTFAARRDLLDALRAMRRDPAAVRKRSDRTRAHLLANHRWSHRLAALAAELGLDQKASV